MSSTVGRSRAVTVVIGSGLLLFASSAVLADSIYDVSVDTSALAGMNATLAFDLVAGGGPSNTIAISGFSTDGLLGVTGPNSGSVTGGLPGSVALNDATHFFSENLQGLTLGTTVSFQLDATANAPGAALADTFAFFILDPTAASSLVTTADPTGADSLFTLQIDGTASGDLGVYSDIASVTAASAPLAVPEPGGSSLMLAAFAFLGALALRRRDWFPGSSV